MGGSNEPKVFVLTPDNYINELLTWMPDQLHDMRQYISGVIKIGVSANSLQCQYMQTAGGEKFRIVTVTPMGDSDSEYHNPLGSDDDVIEAFAIRIANAFEFQKKANQLLKRTQPIEVRMEFTPGPFSV